MKAEERIIELLAEYLKKGDQLTDRTDRLEKSAEQANKSIEMMSRAIAANDIKFNTMNEKSNQELKHLREDQGVMLKELISLSKRVGVVEEKH